MLLQPSTALARVNSCAALFASTAEKSTSESNDGKLIAWQKKVASGEFTVLPQSRWGHNELTLQKNGEAISGIEYEFIEASRTHMALLWTYTVEPFEGLGAQTYLMRSLAARYPSVKSVDGTTTATNTEVIDTERANGLKLEAAFRKSPAYRRAAQAGFKRIDTIEEIIEDGEPGYYYILSKP